MTVSFRVPFEPRGALSWLRGSSESDALLDSLALKPEAGGAEAGGGGEFHYLQARPPERDRRAPAGHISDGCDDVFHDCSRAHTNVYSAASRRLLHMPRVTSISQC